MPDATHEIKTMKFVSKKLDLPLFFVSRNRIKQNYLNPMRSYIERKSLSYTKNCNKEIAKETATTKKQKHIAGFDHETAPSCPQPRQTSPTRGSKIDKWKLAPNRYGMHKEPFAAKKGNFGAYWNIPIRNKNYENRVLWKFYELRLQLDHCSKYKGIFLNNARSRRNTERCMISDINSCYRDPSEPGPNRYFPQIHTISYNAHPLVNLKPPPSHIFYHRSSVPVKRNSIHTANSSFTPGPGRYNVFFPNICPCTWRLVFIPGLQLIIDREKRKKFRRLPYTKVRARNYCSPDWRHVPGHGHKHLFKKTEKMKIEMKRLEKPLIKDVKDTKEAMKTEPKLFADAAYINLITRPERINISFRTAKAMRYHSPEKIIFHCMQKHGVRHKLGINKNVAFGSGAERFKTLKRAKPLTVKDMEKLKKRLPEERRLKDYPVTKTPIADIKLKLNKVPQHMMPVHELDLRKRLFKFLPLPPPKVLATVRDISIDKPNNTFYDKILDSKDFMKQPTSQSESKILITVDN